ncbi:MAG: translation initiation factor IF-2 [Flavobacteriales bacterium]|nr:translation initiation factor IF-2 [Flavobacteriales bacterium]
MADKGIRLSKAAREVNLGIQHVAEFLSEKGFEVDAKPNTKLTSEMYEMLLDEFQADRQMKKESESHAVVEPVVRETVAIRTAEKKAAERAAAEKAAEEAALAAAQKAKAIEEAEAAEQAKKEEEIKKAEETKKKEEETLVAKAEQLEGPKVISKIDLEPSKKKEEVAKEEVKEEAPSEEKKPQTIGSVAGITEENEVEEEEPETVKAQADKLKGTTVLGKIELPVEKERPKRKRKRIVKPKVDVDQVGKQTKKPGSKAPRTKTEISEEEIQKEIKETLARLSGKNKSSSAKLRRAKRDAVAQRTEEEMERLKEEEKVLKLTEFVSVSELAIMMGVPATEVISACMTLGILVSINQRLDAETITLIAEEFGYTVEFVAAEIQEAITEEEDKEEDLIPRPPIVTVMGHVDHGKTSLLDHVRKANVIAGEAGGITQHIGAYQVTMENGKSITFLDTPGHEAFTAMRARGAQVTDVAVIVIAADDSVMPQTREAINHAQAADVPMVFAFNKMDKPGANSDKIREELSQMNILVEEWGGKFQAQEISAKNGTNVDELMEKVLLEAELLELKANPKKNAVGTIIESSLDKGRGYVCTMIVEGGTMRVGDTMVAGQYFGKVKAMFNERGNNIDSAGPAAPVIVLGMNGAPSAGDKFHVLEDEREAKSIANKRMQLQREQGVRTQRHITLDEIGRRIALGEFKELNIILKGDVDGSIEALTDSLQKLSTDKVQVKIIHRAIGQISESDVLLASASDAIIIGFQVRPSAIARKMAEKEEVQIKLYSIIYDAIEEVKDAMEGMLSAKIEEKIIGTAEIREVFKISKVGTIAGCFMIDGKINRNSQIRVIRDGIVIYTGTLGSLKRFKDDVKEVAKGYEFGLNVNNFNDIKVGDNIEAFEEIEVKQKLNA